MTGWISVKDTVPVEGSYVLGYCGRGCVIVDRWRDDKGAWTWSDEEGCTYAITHWMPLPSPPVVVGEES